MKYTRVIKKISLLSLSISSIFTLSTLQAQPATNSWILKKLFQKPLFSLLDSLSTDSTAIRIEPSIKSAQSDWLVREMRASLAGQYDIIDGKSESEQSSITLVLDEVESEIRYLPQRNLFLRVKGYDRKVKTRLSFFVKSEENKVLRAAVKSGKFDDKIPRGSIRVVEDELLPFTQGTKMESQIIRRLVEPVLVTGVTVGIVYLFYSLRSS